MVKVRVMTNYIKYTPEVANDWKQAPADVQKDYPHQFRRVLDASTASQMQSKLWLVNALEPYHPKKVAVIGGWFCHYLTEMLIDIGVESVHNFEIDEDSKNISPSLPYITTFQLFSSLMYTSLDDSAPVLVATNMFLKPSGRCKSYPLTR